MKKLFKQVVDNPLISGSAIIFSGTLVANVFNFLFNFFMSRNLSISDYGSLASLVSLILIATLAADSFAPAIVTLAGSYFAKEEHEKIGDLFLQVTKISFLAGIITFSVFFLFTKNIGGFFNINNNFWVILVGAIIFFSFMGASSRSILQAKLSFTYLAFMNILSSLLKFSGGALLIILGKGLTGALIGFLVAFFIAYFLSLIPLRGYLKYRKNNSAMSIAKLFSYGGIATLSLMGLTFIITTDIILVKHFFSSTEAGLYAGLSLIGRVIYFFSAPIGLVMFPLIVHRYAKDEDYRHIFKLALLLVFVLSISVTIFYFLFPEFVVRLFLKKEEYLKILPMVGPFGIFITIYSMVSILINFYLSIKKIYIFIPVFAAAILQAFLLWVFHNSFSQVLFISTASISLLFIYLLLYYWKLYGRKAAN